MQSIRDFLRHRTATRLTYPIPMLSIGVCIDCAGNVDSSIKKLDREEARPPEVVTVQLPTATLWVSVSYYFFLGGGRAACVFLCCFAAWPSLPAPCLLQMSFLALGLSAHARRHARNRHLAPSPYWCWCSVGIFYFYTVVYFVFGFSRLPQNRVY